MRFTCSGLFCMLGAVAALPAAPVPKGGPPRLLVASAGDDRNRQLHLVDPATAKTKPITEKGDNTEPAWSPDGKTIAFASTRDGRSHIWLIGADGTNPRQLTDKAGGGEHLRWSPDGLRLVYASGRDGLTHVYVADTATGRETRLTDADTAGTMPEWSPDGRLIAYSRFAVPCATYVMAADGSNKQKVTGAAGGQAGVWNPHGGQLACVASDDTPNGWELFLIGADGKNFKKLARGGPEGARWSPDGKTVAYGERVNDYVQVTTIGADGTGSRALTTENTHKCVRWSPDGRSLSFIRDRGPTRRDGILLMCDPDGANVKDLLTGVTSAEWKPK